MGSLGTKVLPAHIENRTVMKPGLQQGQGGSFVAGGASCSMERSDTARVKDTGQHAAGDNGLNCGEQTGKEQVDDERWVE